MATKTKDPVVANAVEAVSVLKAAEEEEAKLEKELAEIDEAMEENAIPGLTDTGQQRIQALMDEFSQWDKQRAINKTKTEIAREAGDVEEAKNLIAVKPRLLKHLNIVLKHLVDAYAEEADVREEMVNWLCPQAMPSNLRPLLVKHLKERKGIDVTALVERAQDIEEERRKLRRLTHQQVH